MLICICPDPLECPAIGSDVSCFPWCDYLEEVYNTDESIDCLRGEPEDTRIDTVVSLPQTGPEIGQRPFPASPLLWRSSGEVISDEMPLY